MSESHLAILMEDLVHLEDMRFNSDGEGGAATSFKSMEQAQAFVAALLKGDWSASIHADGNVLIQNDNVEFCFLGNGYIVMTGTPR